QDPNKGTSQNKQQFPTNTINKPNVSGSNQTSSGNGSSTIPTKQHSNKSSTPVGSLASTIPLNTSNETNESQGSTGQMLPPPSASNPAMNAGGQGHIYLNRNLTILGGNRTLQRAGHFILRVYHSGIAIVKSI